MKNRMIFEAKCRNGELKYKFNRKALLRDGGLLYLLGDTTQTIIRKSEMTEAEVLETVGYLFDSPSKAKHDFDFAYNEKNKKVRANPIMIIVEVSKILHRHSSHRYEVSAKKYLSMAMTYYEDCFNCGVYWSDLFFTNTENIREKHPHAAEILEGFIVYDE